MLKAMVGSTWIIRKDFSERANKYSKDEEMFTIGF